MRLPTAAPGALPPDNTAPLKLFGIEIPLPHWAVSIVAVVAIVALPFVLFFGTWHFYKDQKLTQELNDVQKANEELIRNQDIYNETNKHLHDDTLTDFHNEPSKLIVRYYASDGCIYVLRSAGSTAIPTWLKDPSRTSPLSPSPGLVTSGIAGELIGLPHRASFQQIDSPASPLLPLLPASLRASMPIPPLEFVPVQSNPCGGKCVNPHPGSFQSTNGQKQGCWQQVWRKWPDGCTHYQWFNTCSSYWDSDKTGNPKVYWTCCRH